MTTINRNTDHRHTQDRYTGPSVATTEAWSNGAERAYNTRASMTAETQSPAVVAKTIAKTMHEHFNGGEWREAAEQAIPCEFRPKGTAATPVQLVNMANRNVGFDPRQSIYDRSQFTKGEAIVGDMIFTEPTNTAALFSSRFTLLDAHVIAGTTGNSLAQMMDKWTNDFEKDCGSTVVDILTKSPSVEAKQVTIAGTTPRDRAEDWIDALTMSINQSVGNSLGDFVLLMHQSEKAVLERAAQRAGVESIEDLLGCRTQFYSKTNRGVFMLPKGFASLSFREGHDGAIWKIHCTRNSAVLGWDIEISGVADVMAQAKVKIKLGNPADESEKLQTEVVPFPLVTRVTAQP